MTRILVDPHQLRSLSVQLQRVSGDLQAVEGQLAGALGGLTWEARQKANLDTRASHARGQARELVTEVEKMSRYLERKAQVFDEADGRGVPSMLQLSRARIDAMRATAPWLRFPSRRVNALAGLGAVLGGSSLVGALHLPALTGIAVSLAALTALSAGFLEQVQGFLERIWRGSANSFAESESLLTGTTRLGELLDSDPAEEAGRHVDSQSERTTRLGELLAEEDEDERTDTATTQPEAGQVDNDRTPITESTIPLKPADPRDYESCALYAQARRPDLGRCGGNGGAYNYIGSYRNTDQYYRVDEATVNGDLTESSLRPGVAVVWDRDHGGAHPEYGHVAIIEEVGADYIRISEANWPTRRPPGTILAEDLVDLHFIL